MDRPEGKSEAPAPATYCPRCGYPLAKSGREKEMRAGGELRMVHKAQLLLPALLILISCFVMASGKGGFGLLLLIMGVIWLHTIILMPWWRR